jgi:hypothetical protein
MATRSKGKAAAGTPPLKASEVRALRVMMDKAAIRETLENYYHAIDAHHLNDLNNVFTPDAKIDFSGGLVKYVGGKGMIKGIQDILKGGGISSSNHFSTSTRVSVSGDTAKTDSVSAVFLMSERAGGGTGTVIVRGLRYRDEWIRTPAGWRIHYRLHTRGWAYETLAVRPDLKPGKGKANIR